jgi:hypothetical protein
VFELMLVSTRYDINYTNFIDFDVNLADPIE